jgi:hypothetical protein
MRRISFTVLNIITVCLVIFSTNFAYADRGGRSIAVRNYVCVFDLTKDQYLTDDQIRLSVSALEKAGNTLDLGLFKFQNTINDHIISKAVGFPTDMTTLFQSLIRKGKYTVPRAVERIMGRLQEVETPRRAKYTIAINSISMSAANSASIQNRVPENSGELITARLRKMSEAGARPNLFNIAALPKGDDLIFLVNATYEGSLFAAVKAAGIDVQDTFQRNLNEKFYSAKELIEAITQFRNNKNSVQTLDILPSLASEFPPEDADLVRTLLTAMIQLPPDLTSAKPAVFAEICSVHLGRKIEVGQVARMLRILATNRSLLGYLEM